MVAIAVATLFGLLLWVGAALIVLDGPRVRAFRIPNGSMEPAMMVGDFITVHYFSGSDAAPIRRTEIVTYVSPTDESLQLSKRVVGLPGDTLEMRHGALSLNGRPMAETYAWYADTTDDETDDEFAWQRRFVIGEASRDTAHYEPTRDNWGPIVVPPAQYFVLGDNRDSSYDSRYVGFVPARNVFGEVRRAYFSRDTTGHIRWSRFGHRIR